MQEKIRGQQYVMTLHAYEEMSDDGLTIFDVERGILTSEIQERQRDQSTGEWKYRLTGKVLRGHDVEIVAKLSPTDTLVIVTVYSLGEPEAE